MPPRATDSENDERQAADRRLVIRLHDGGWYGVPETRLEEFQLSDDEVEQILSAQAQEQQAASAASFAGFGHQAFAFQPQFSPAAGMFAAPLAQGHSWAAQNFTGAFLRATPGSFVRAVPGAFVRATPGSFVRAVPGSFVRATPGSFVRAVPGAFVRAAPGSFVRATPGAFVRAAPGALVRNVPLVFQHPAAVAGQGLMPAWFQ